LTAVHGKVGLRKNFYIMYAYIKVQSVTQYYNRTEIQTTTFLLAKEIYNRYYGMQI